MRGLSVVAASGGHSSSRCAGLSLSRPLLLRSTGSRRAGSVVVAHGPSCSAACGIFPDQGSNPCPLLWQADSQPLCHQGSPQLSFLIAATTPLPYRTQLKGMPHPLLLLGEAPACLPARALPPRRLGLEPGCTDSPPCLGSQLIPIPMVSPTAHTPCQGPGSFRTRDFGAGVPNLWDLMPDDLKWS